MAREDGFLPILVIMVIVAVSAVSGVTLYYIKEKPEQKLVKNQRQPTNYVPSSHFSPSPSPSASDGIAKDTKRSTASQLPVPVRVLTSSPVPSINPKVQTKLPDSSLGFSENLNQQFATIEQEILEGKAKGSLFSPSHSDRILNDLNNLESKGYLKSEIDRLRQIVIELSPHLKDQVMQSTSPMVSPLPSQTLAPSPIPNCLKTNPILISDITDFTKIQKITAPGTQSSEGPKGHSFIWTGGLNVPIYAPVDAVLESGSYSKDNADSPSQYVLYFDVKGVCNFQMRFAHIDEPIESIKQNFPSTPKIADSRGSPVANRVEFKAGDLIGYAKGNIPSGNWDFGLYDTSKEGVLAQYGSYGIHRYSVCWVDFYSSAKQQQYRVILEGPKLVCSF